MAQPVSSGVGRRDRRIPRCLLESSRQTSLVATPFLEGKHRVTLGLDPHPSPHTAAALDENGFSLANLTVPSTLVGLAQLHQFASRR